MPQTPEDDPFAEFQINDEWISGARVNELSAQERADRYARINQGNRQVEREAETDRKQSKRKSRPKLWPWFAFAGLCVVVIGLAYVMMYR